MQGSGETEGGGTPKMARAGRSLKSWGSLDLRERAQVGALA